MKLNLFLLLAGMLTVFNVFPVSGQHYFVYTGSYTSSAEEGINVYDFDAAKPSMHFLFTVKGVQDPSFLIIHPTGRYLYAVNELMSFEGKSSGAVSAFAIDAASGNLKLLNSRPTGGTAPCHLSVDPTGKWLFTANYGGGNVTVFPLLKDGRIGPSADIVRHHGHSVNPDRQEAPHVHEVVFDKNSGRLFVPDLGLDKIFIYNFDPKTGKLSPAKQPWIRTPPGRGPRHLALSKDGETVYVLGEISSSVMVYHLQSGIPPALLQETSMLPDDFKGPNTGAEITLSPDERFLYASNRGHHSLVQYTVDPVSGKLKVKAYFPSGGKNPRFFCFDPTGSYVFSANQTSDNILLYKYDKESGRLSATGIEVKPPQPVCLAFLRKRFTQE
ncbi:MAG: lactonase family protein [Chlorobi bacterium]|nr:lactonase family protein [Chlorobiota bacterium]